MPVLFLGQNHNKQHLPLAFYSNKVAAGFPSPAQDYIERSLDLNELCIKHPAATFFVQVSGDSMKNTGIYDGDILVVDRALEARHGNIIVAALNGEFTVKEYCTKPSYKLIPHNPDYPVIEIKPDDDFKVFGVVRSLLRNFAAV
jgi:DNA polymerase V